MNGSNKIDGWIEKKKHGWLEKMDGWMDRKMDSSMGTIY